MVIIVITMMVTDSSDVFVTGKQKMAQGEGSLCTGACNTKNTAYISSAGYIELQIRKLHFVSSKFTSQSKLPITKK